MRPTSRRTSFFHTPNSPPDDILCIATVLCRATYASREKGAKAARQVAGAIVEIARKELGS